MEYVYSIGMWLLPYVNISIGGYSVENILYEMRL